MTDLFFLSIYTSNSYYNKTRVNVCVAVYIHGFRHSRMFGWIDGCTYV